MTPSPAGAVPAPMNRSAAPSLRLVLVAAFGFALLAPGQVRSAHAAVAISPASVNNLTKATLSMSGYSAAHDVAKTAMAPVVQISGPTVGPSQSYTPQNIRFEGTTLKVDVNLVSGTEATGLLGAGPGTYTVKICQYSCTGSVPIEDSGTFTVVAAPVDVTTTEPTVVALAGTTSVTLTGTFARGASVSTDAAGVTPGAATTPDGAHLVVPITTTATTAPGFYDLTVKNTDGSKDVCVRCVRVANFQLSSTTPATALNKAGAQTIAVTGVGLPTSGLLEATLTPRPAIAGQASIRVLAAAAASATSWSAAFDLADAATGPYALLLSAPDDSSVGLCTCLVSVDPEAPPTIAGLTPGAVGQGAKDFAVTVTGAHFPHGAVLSVPTASKVTLGATTWISGTTLTTKVSVDPAAPAGKVNIIVTNPSAKGTFTCTGCLVVNPRPVVESLSPDTLVQGSAHKALTLTGANFSADTRLVFTDGVTIESSKFVDATHMSLVVSVSRKAKGGLHSLTADNPDGGNSGPVTALAVQRLVKATLVADRATVTYGQGVRLSGVITYTDTGAGVADQTVALNAATTAGMQALMDVTTDAKGAWHVVVSPKQNTRYQLAAVAVGGAPTTSPIRAVVVAPRITITAPKPGSTSRGGSLTVSGVLAPALKVAVTVFTRDSHGKVRSVRGTSDGAGKFSARIPLPAGTYRLWVVSAATKTYGSGVSPTITFDRR